MTGTRQCKCGANERTNPELFGARKKDRQTGPCLACLAMTQRARRYGATPHDIQIALEWQRGQCAICATPIDTITANIDHHHAPHQKKTNPTKQERAMTVRGLLCKPCNTVTMATIDRMERAGQLHVWLQWAPPQVLTYRRRYRERITSGENYWAYCTRRQQGENNELHLARQPRKTTQGRNAMPASAPRRD